MDSFIHHNRFDISKNILVHNKKIIASIFDHILYYSTLPGFYTAKFQFHMLKDLMI